jgi:hypothetical protein
MYGFKSVKWLDRIEGADDELVGYWEQRGYAPDAWITRPEAPRLRHPNVHRFPAAGVTLSVPAGWTVRPGTKGGILVATATPPAAPGVAVTVFDYRSERDVAAADLEQFATTAVLFGSAPARQTRSDVAGHDAVTFEAGGDDGSRVRDTFVGNGKQILLVRQVAPGGEWARHQRDFEAVLGALRLGPPRPLS